VLIKLNKIYLKFKKKKIIFFYFMNESKKYKKLKVLGKGSFGVAYLVNSEIEN
jgi:predicted Ser/Thr protein kinase